MIKPAHQGCRLATLPELLDEVEALLVAICRELEITRIAELPKAIQEINSLSMLAEVKINEAKYQIPK